MAAVKRIQELLGGELVTGPIANDLDIVRAVRRGLPTAAIDHLLQETDLGFPVIEAHVLPRRTFKRRQEANQRLDPAESDRLVRVANLVAAAEETFGDQGKALIWLQRENRALDGQRPLSLADTDHGSRAVEALLGRIGHGLAA